MSELTQRLIPAMNRLDNDAPGIVRAIAHVVARQAFGLYQEQVERVRWVLHLVVGVWGAWMLWGPVVYVCVCAFVCACLCVCCLHPHRQYGSAIWRRPECDVFPYSLPTGKATLNEAHATSSSKAYSTYDNQVVGSPDLEENRGGRELLSVRLRSHSHRWAAFFLVCAPSPVSVCVCALRMQQNISGFHATRSANNKVVGMKFCEALFSERLLRLNAFVSVFCCARLPCLVPHPVMPVV